MAFADTIKQLGFEPLPLPQSVNLFSPGLWLNPEKYGMPASNVVRVCKLDEKEAIDKGPGPSSLTQSSGHSEIISIEASASLSRLGIPAQLRAKLEREQVRWVRVHLSDFETWRLVGSPVDKAVNGPCAQEVPDPLEVVGSVLIAKSSVELYDATGRKLEGGVSAFGVAGGNVEHQTGKSVSGSFQADEPLVFGFTRATVSRWHPDLMVDNASNVVSVDHKFYRLAETKVFARRLGPTGRRAANGKPLYKHVMHVRLPSDLARYVESVAYEFDHNTDPFEREPSHNGVKFAQYTTQWGCIPEGRVKIKFKKRSLSDQGLTWERSFNQCRSMS